MQTLSAVEIMALDDKWQEWNERENRRAALISTVVAQSVGADVTIEDFLGQPEAEPEAEAEEDPEAQAAQIKKVFSFLARRSESG